MAEHHTADRMFDVLQSVGRFGIASMPEIEAACGLPTTTTHRLIQTLIRRGFVMRTGKGRYQLGIAVVDLAGRISERNLIRDAARGHLRRLSRRVRNHVHLGRLDDFMVTYLVKQSHGRKRLLSVEGTQLEAYCSALGKVLLSGLDDDAIDRYVDEGSLIALTDRTITDGSGLRREIALVRRRGWAIDDGEITPRLRCIAVPVRAPNKRIVAAVSISTLADTGTEISLEAFLEPLEETARVISRHVFARTEGSDVH